MKIAAAEAIWNTQDPADFVLMASIDEENTENKNEIRIPNALSFLLYSSFTGQVEGLNDLQADAVQRYGPGNYIPPVSDFVLVFSHHGGSRSADGSYWLSLRLIRPG